MINVHYTRTRDAGNRFGSPALYYDLGDVQSVDLDTPLAEAQKDEPLVIGGGGLLYAPDSLGRLVGEHRGPVIGWGFGNNKHGSDILELPPRADEYDLLGMRDWGLTGPEWAPCPSCEHHAFDVWRNRSARRRWVHYKHRDSLVDLPVATMLNTRSSLEEVLAFMSSAEVVVTDSWHGVYWATLLDRRVVCMPGALPNPPGPSNRMTGFRHPPTMVHPTAALSATGPRHPGALEDCRRASRAFAEKVFALLGLPLKTTPLHHGGDDVPSLPPETP